MKLSKLLNPDRLIRPLRWVVWPAIIAYVASMVVIPWVSGGFQWRYLQEVWDHWQSLNVGMLALIASVIAFEATRYKEETQRSRDFLAARAFLPESFSELCVYFKGSAAVYSKAWEDSAPHRPAARPPATVPTLPSSYKSVFAECIKHAEPNVGEALTAILVELQVHDSRLRELVTNYPSVRLTIFSYMYSVGELQTRVNKLFPFARGEEGFDSSPISWDEFHNAYKNIKIHVEDYDLGPVDGKKYDLITFTQRAIARLKGDEQPAYTDWREPNEVA